MKIAFVILSFIGFNFLDFETESTKESLSVLKCSQIDSTYSTDQIIELLHDSDFLYGQGSQALSCYVHLINRLSDSAKFHPHYICDYIGCSYSSIWVNDSQSFIFRYDLRKLMQILNYKDSLKYVDKYYNKFKSFDSVLILNYAKKFRLKDNLEPIWKQD